jgi:hypothetical protein
MTAFFSPAATIAIAASTFLAVAGLSPAQAAPGAGTLAANGTSSNLVKIRHGDSRRYRRDHRRYRRGHVVDAPFAHVESGRHTVVDAPFVHVYKGRHGKHIVAPFVDLWEPR